MNSISKKHWPILIVAGAVYFAAAARFYDHTVDDAFISYRYASNFAEGHGIVFNAGERVEGYTNFLWVVLVSGGIRLGVDPELFGRVLGLLSGFALVAGVWFFAARHAKTYALVWVAPILIAAHPALAVWATGGLETPLFACLVLWGVGLAMSGADEGVDRGRVPYASAILLGLASMTRPEGPAFAGLVAGVWLVLSVRTAADAKRWLLWVVLFSAIFVPYFAWRFNYYGKFLPNTFYAKVDPGGSQIGRGLTYTHSFWMATGYWLLAPISGVVLAAARKRAAYLLAPLLFFSFYIFYVGGDGLPMMRFFVPLLGLIVLCSVLGADQWIQRFGSKNGAIAAVTLFFALSWGYSLRANFSGKSYDYVQQDIREVGAWREIGRWFGENARPGESIAVIPAGAMPYFSRLTTIDMLGLNDLTIARAPIENLGEGQAGHERHDVDYVLGRAPTYIIIGVYGLSPEPIRDARGLQFYYPAETALAASSEFRQRYSAIQGKTESGYFLFFRLNDEV